MAKAFASHADLADKQVTFARLSEKAIPTAVWRPATTA